MLSLSLFMDSGKSQAPLKWIGVAYGPYLYMSVFIYLILLID